MIASGGINVVAGDDVLRVNPESIGVSGSGGVYGRVSSGIPLESVMNARTVAPNADHYIGIVNAVASRGNAARKIESCKLSALEEVSMSIATDVEVEADNRSLSIHAACVIGGSTEVENPECVVNGAVAILDSGEVSSHDFSRIIDPGGLVILGVRKIELPEFCLSGVVIEAVSVRASGGVIAHHIAVVVNTADGRSGRSGNV